MKYRLASLSNERHQFVMRLCNSCNIRNGERGHVSCFLRSPSLRLDSISPVLAASWPYICPACALAATNYSFLSVRPDGEQVGIVVPRPNNQFNAELIASGRFAFTNNLIEGELTNGRVVFYSRLNSLVVNSFSAVEKPWASCCSNATCPGCSRQIKSKNGGVIVRMRRTNRANDELLCRYCSSDIVMFYRNMFAVSKEILEAANWL